MINQGDMDETNQKIQSWRSRAGEFGEFGELAVIPRELCMEKAGVNEVRGPPRMFLANYFVKVERKGRHQILFARAMRIQSEIHCFFWADGVEWKNLRPEKREERSFRKTINSAAEISWDAT
jgi:hypothetical protein